MPFADVADAASAMLSTMLAPVIDMSCKIPSSNTQILKLIKFI